LQKLNSLGYGKENGGLVLNLMFNPQGPVLPPPQQQLETDYRQYLAENFGVVFNQLHILTNMPIKRFGSTLISKGEFESYMTLLRDAYQEQNTQQLMCKNMVSIDWQGYLYDCDFNQMLDIGLCDQGGSALHLQDLKRTNLQDRPILVADHCYGCTAGQGSSCGGALDA
jgi:radical SAM/Cys-rich protein